MLQALASASALFAGLVHPDAQLRPIERLRHGSFLAAKLCFSALALAGAPVFVAIHGAPTPVQAAIFALALAPVLAATAVSRKGWLLAGHVATTLAFFGIALLVAVGTPDGRVGACCWLVPAAVEGFASGNASLRRFAGIAALVLAGAFVAPLGIDGPPGGGAPLLAALAVIPALQAALRAEMLLQAAAVTLAKAEARSQALCAASGDVAIDIDAQGFVERVAPGCESMLGVEGASLEGRGLFEQVQVADRPAFLKLLSDAAHGEGTQVARLRLRRAAPDGSRGVHYAWVEMRACRHPRDRSARTDRGRVVALLREVPPTHRDAAPADEAEHLAGAATSPRDAFLANMSHELRTPLNAIIGFSDLLCSQTLRPSDPEKQREYARIIGQSGQSLLSAINATLDLSRIQSGTFALAPERFAVVPLIEQCCDMIHLRAEAARVSLEKDLPDGLGELVGDRRACRQILLDLLADAVKRTPQRGRITVAARIEGSTLSVTLAGAGTHACGRGAGPASPPEGPPLRVDETIGRSLTRGLVELQGGQLTTASAPGDGAGIVLRLPLDGGAVPGGGGPAAPVRFAHNRDSSEHGMKQSA